ncbi:MAG TPA: ATP-binding protein, partial [Anaerolineae bacterium]|nr:ATP-binding protein [Anaerolineae bacterium]
MEDHLPLYDTAAIRELLLAAFTADDLHRFCQDRADFRQVLRNVGAKPSLNELADQILTHCETHLLFDPLLAQVRQLVPRQYEHFEPRLLLPEAIRAGVPCPYRGLEVFYLEHAGNYFGRQAMVDRLLDTLNRTNFVAVVGPSGCGKSSLVRAGMVPALRRGALAGSEAWQVEILVPGEDALRALALTLVQRLMPRATPVDRLAAARKLARHLSAGTLPLGDVLAEIKAHAPDLSRLLLVIDQFEETFTLCKDRAQSNFFLQKLLELAATPWLTVILTLRADFYGRVLEDEAFGRRVDTGLVNVLPMTRQERREAVEQPALQAGRRFEEGLVERILDAVEGSPGDLPLLEFALTELWGRQQANGLLTHAAYEEIGEVRGAIARSADDAFARFTP